MRKKLTKKQEAQKKKDMGKLIKTANDLCGIWANENPTQATRPASYSLTNSHLVANDYS